MNQIIGWKQRQTLHITHTSRKSRDLKLEVLSIILFMLYFKHRPIRKLMFIIHTYLSNEMHIFQFEESF